MYNPGDVERAVAFDLEQLEALNAHYIHHYPDLLLWAAGTAVDSSFRGAATVAHDLAGTYAFKQFSLSFDRSVTADQVYEAVGQSMTEVNEGVSPWSTAELLGRQIARYSLGALASRWYSLDMQDIGRAISHMGTRSVMHENLVDAVTQAPKIEGFTDIDTHTLFHDVVEGVRDQAVAAGSLEVARAEIIEPTITELLALAGPVARNYQG